MEVPFVEAMSRRLKKRDISIVTSFSGHEALDVLEKDRSVEVAIFDVKMPGMDGLETLGEIRKQDFDVAILDLKMEDMDGIEVLKIFKKAYPEMAVIMLTGHGSETAAKEGLEYGAFDYLTKPCDLEDLVKKINQAVQYEE